MMIDGSLGSLEQPGKMKTERSINGSPAEREANRASEASGQNPTAPVGDSVASGDDLHRADALREAAGRLLEEGSLDASLDGAVRPSRVDLARQKFEAGAFDRRDVIARIVDRLIEQWQL